MLRQQVFYTQTDGRMDQRSIAALDCRLMPRHISAAQRNS